MGHNTRKKKVEYRWIRKKSGLFLKVGDDPDEWIAEIAKGADGKWWAEYLVRVEYLASVQQYVVHRFRTLTEAKVVIDFRQREICLS